MKTDYIVDICDNEYNISSNLLDILVNITCNGSSIEPPVEVIVPRVTDWFYFIINNLIALLTLSGNLMTLWIMARYRQVRSVTNTFIISLACADLLMGCIYPLYNVLNYTTFAYEGRNLKKPCATCLYFIIVSAGVSNFSLLAVTIDRYIAIIHPFAYRLKVTYTRASVSIIVIWIYIMSATVTIIPVYGIDFQQYYNLSCSLLNLIPKWYFFGIIIPHMLVPNIISKILYCKILYVARKQARKINNENKQILGAQTNNNEKKAATTMAIILVLFFLCWLPYLTLHIVIHSIGTDSPPWLYHLLEVSKILSFSNSFINPIIYAWKNKDFRYAIKLRCREWGKNSVSPSAVQTRSQSITSELI